MTAFLNQTMKFSSYNETVTRLWLRCQSLIYKKVVHYWKLG